MAPILILGNKIDKPRPGAAGEEEIKHIGLNDQITGKICNMHVFYYVTIMLLIGEYATERIIEATS